MIQESIIWGRLNSYSRDLLKENNQLQITWDLKIRVDLLENREEMAKCLFCKYRAPASIDMGEEGMIGWGHFYFPAFPLVPGSLKCSGRSSGAGDGAEEGLVPAGAEDGSGSNTVVYVTQQVSQCLFQCPLRCGRGATFAGCLSTCGIQSWPGHAGTVQDSGTQQW